MSLLKDLRPRNIPEPPGPILGQVTSELTRRMSTGEGSCLWGHMNSKKVPSASECLFPCKRDLRVHLEFSGKY